MELSKISTEDLEKLATKIDEELGVRDADDMLKKNSGMEGACFVSHDGDALMRVNGIDEGGFMMCGVVENGDAVVTFTEFFTGDIDEVFWQWMEPAKWESEVSTKFDKVKEILGAGQWSSNSS